MAELVVLWPALVVLGHERAQEEVHLVLEARRDDDADKLAEAVPADLVWVVVRLRCLCHDFEDLSHDLVALELQDMGRFLDHLHVDLTEVLELVCLQKVRILQLGQDVNRHEGSVDVDEVAPLQASLLLESRQILREKSVKVRSHDAWHYVGWSRRFQDVFLRMVDELGRCSCTWTLRILQLEFPLQLPLDELLFAIWVEPRDDLLVLHEFHAVGARLLHHFDGVRNFVLLAVRVLQESSLLAHSIDDTHLLPVESLVVGRGDIGVRRVDASFDLVDHSEVASEQPLARGIDACVGGGGLVPGWCPCVAVHPIRLCGDVDVLDEAALATRLVVQHRGARILAIPEARLALVVDQPDAVQRPHRVSLLKLGGVELTERP